MGSFQCCSQRDRDDETQPRVGRAGSEALSSLKGTAMREIDKVFDQIDCDKNGTISKAEFHQAKAKLKELGYQVDLVKDFDDFDKNDDGKVDREEFRNEMRNKAADRADVLHELATHNPEFETSVATLWKAADQDGDGHVDVDELCKFLNHIDRKLGRPERTPAQAMSLLRKFDLNYDNRLQKHEFEKMMESTFMDAILDRA